MPQPLSVLSLCVRHLLFVVIVSASAARAEPNAGPNLEPSATPSAAQSSGTVNINTASAEELERLPGIGPSRARAILALRAQLTRFSRLEELLRVKGIGRATFRKLRPMLRLQGDTTLSDTSKHSR